MTILTAGVSRTYFLYFSPWTEALRLAYYQVIVAIEKVTKRWSGRQKFN